MSATCRSCDAPIEWVIVKKSGKRMPLDPDPIDVGNIVKLDDELDPETGAALVEYITKTVVIPSIGALFDPPRDQREHYTSHFATCPEADKHRR